MPGTITISAFYKFVTVDDAPALKERLSELASEHQMFGSILVAPEGVNGTIAGRAGATAAFFDTVRSDPRFADLEIKESFASFVPFRRMKVRLKREIVTLRQAVDPTSTVGTYVEPDEWNQVLSDPDVLIIDTRNNEEVSLGTFTNAINPETESFTEFAAFAEGLDPTEHPKVAMFCTGGIRCEKASSYLLEQGFQDVVHLRGGILNYLEKVPEQDSMWQGECFVFDERVTVDHSLTPGDYTLCRGCRRALAPEDCEHELYEAGVSCVHCSHSHSDAKRASLRERHRQELLARQNGDRHIARSE